MAVALASEAAAAAMMTASQWNHSGGDDGGCLRRSNFDLFRMKKKGFRKRNCRAGFVVDAKKAEG